MAEILHFPMKYRSACFCSPISLGSLFDRRKAILWKDNKSEYSVGANHTSCQTWYYQWLLPLSREENTRIFRAPWLLNLSIRMSKTNKRKKNTKNISKSQNSKNKDIKKNTRDSEARESLSDKLDGNVEYSNTEKEVAYQPTNENSSSNLHSLPSDTTLPFHTVEQDVSQQQSSSPKGSADAPVFEDSIKALTDNFKKKRDEFIQNLERDPNYGFKRLDEDDSYDWAAALIGRGSPTKKGFFMLPYLQTGHIVCLVVVLLGAFVYYPGFYLTELPESTREVLRKALAVVFSVNGILAGYAGWEASRRNQPTLLWIVKCMMLGGLALNELQQNVPLTVKSPKQDSLLPTSIHRK